VRYAVQCLRLYGAWFEQISHYVFLLLRFVPLLFCQFSRFGWITGCILCI
jgi:hypothetical protein